LPEQHYLYKATMATAYLERTGQAPLTRTGDKYTVIDEYYRRCEEARQMLLTRPDIIAAHQALRDASCHADPQHHLLVQDFLYYVSQAEPAAGARPVHYWLYAPGSNAEHWEAFRREGIMAMGWEDLGDYAQFGSVAEVADELRALFKTTSSKKNDANAIYDMAHNIAKGDVIIAKKGRSEYLGYGIVTGDHYFDPDRPFFRNCRKVEWVRHGSWPEEGSPIVLKTLTDITKYPAYVARLKELIGIDASGAEPLGMVMANITWNSLDWTAPSQDKSNHGYVKQGNTPMESWNFDLSNPRNPADKVLGFIQHTAPPKLFGNNNLVVFYSAGKVVGFYGKAQLLKDKPRASDGMEYNIIADRSLAVVLPNKLEDLKEKGYYEDKQKVGMNGFIYLKEKDTALAMIDEAIELNPTVGDRLRALRRWMTDGSTTTPGTTQKATMEQPLNSILYGPPGTGKTFYTVNQALGIIEDRSLSTIDQEDRGQLRERFTKYREEGRIEAVTFHQAISYEDFIEGIKPRLDDGEEEARDLGYVIQDGLFKRIAVRAAFEYVERDSSKAGAALAFGDRFDAYVAEVTERLEAEEQVVLPTRGGKKILVTGVSDRGNLLLKHENGDRTYTVSKARSEKLFNAFPDQTDVKNIYLDFRKVI
ncbi:MAG: hypothetical protein KDB95_15200, partial [Flavobacteriales bacterium]|nr:hypothetical protein [Flavobacteriales bacterium]